MESRIEPALCVECALTQIHVDGNGPHRVHCCYRSYNTNETYSALMELNLLNKHSSANYSLQKSKIMRISFEFKIFGTRVKLAANARVLEDVTC